MGFNEPIVMLGSSFLYEEGEGADEDLRDNLPLPLAQCPAGGVRDGTLLTLEDFTQKLNVSNFVPHIHILSSLFSSSNPLFYALFSTFERKNGTLDNIHASISTICIQKPLHWRK